MILGSLVREVLLSTLNEWREYLSHNRADVYSEKLEKILLFHGAFSNFFDESLQQKVHSLYEQCLNKLWVNQEQKLLIYDFAPIIILEKVFTDFAQDEDEWFHKIIHLMSSRTSGSRTYSTRLMMFYLNKNVDFKNEVMGVSLKDLFIKNAYNNIEEQYYDNIYLFALIDFLNIPSQEKQEIFSDLLDFAQKQEAKHDISNLQKLAYRTESIPNPFYSYLMGCQQSLLGTLVNEEFNPQKTGTAIQLDLFSQPIKPKFNYYFEDVRLGYFLPKEE
jgi:hypothetical protein